MVVGDHDERRALRLIELPQKQHQVSPGGRVQISGRFVGQDERRIVGQGARHCHALALPAGELAGKMAGPVGQADQPQQFVGARPSGFGREPAQHRHFHVLQRRERWQQVVELEDEADGARPEGVLVGEPGQVGPVDQHAPRSRTIEGAQDIQQRALAASTRPHHGHQLAPRHAQVDSIEGAHFGSVAIDAPKLLRFDQPVLFGHRRFPGGVRAPPRCRRKPSSPTAVRTALRRVESRPCSSPPTPARRAARSAPRARGRRLPAGHRR